ncbi:MAG: peptidoglycan-binding protein [Rhizobiaceae bacterium]|nr:peptidoglycan-binding protein [Rhizobiaceae bacterium]
MFKKTIRSTAKVVAQHPTQAVGGFAFLLGFSLITANALFSQSGNHPGPIWMTRDGMVVRAIPTTNLRGPKAHSVYTQRISMRNIPVPTTKPKLLSSYDASSSLLVEIQKGLTSAGFYFGDIDGIYGRESRAAILKYQTSRNLPQTGKPDLDLLGTFRKRKLSQSVTGDTDVKLVKLIQSGLIQYGSSDLTIDGIYGDRTKDAIRAFQSRYKLSVDGQPSRAVLDKLTSIGAIKKS